MESVRSQTRSTIPAIHPLTESPRSGGVAIRSVLEQMRESGGALGANCVDVRADHGQFINGFLAACVFSSFNELRPEWVGDQRRNLFLFHTSPIVVRGAVLSVLPPPQHISRAVRVVAPDCSGWRFHAPAFAGPMCHREDARGRLFRRSGRFSRITLGLLRFHEALSLQCHGADLPPFGPVSISGFGADFRRGSRCACRIDVRLGAGPLFPAQSFTAGCPPLKNPPGYDPVTSWPRFHSLDSKVLYQLPVSLLLRRFVPLGFPAFRHTVLGTLRLAGPLLPVRHAILSGKSVALE